MRTMAPYPLLAQNPALLMEKLGLELDTKALEDIRMAWEHWSKGNWDRRKDIKSIIHGRPNPPLPPAQWV